MISVKFTQQVAEFLKELNPKHRDKIIKNIELSTLNINPKLLKKINNEIWEFRTLYQGIQYRILCFWDKRDSENAIIFCSNGFIKKTSKTPSDEIFKASQIRKTYLRSN